jgi:hypothetical protein
VQDEQEGQTGGDTVARALYRGLGGRDAAALAALLDETSLLHVSGRSGLAGDFQGRDAILALARTMAAETEGTLGCAAVGSVSRREEATVLQGRVSGDRGGRHLDVEVRLTVTLDEGMLREAWVEWVGQSEVDEFWS